MSDEVQLPSEPEENRLPLVQSQPVDAPMPGKRLKEAREAKGISVAEVAHALKFGVRQVEALEADDFSNLQGATFQRGFIRSYARYLKEDPAPLLAMLDVTAPPVEAEIVAPSNMGAATSEPFLERNQRWVLLLLAFVAAAAVGAYWLTQKDGSAPSKVETEANTPPAPVETQPTVVAPTPVPLNAPNGASGAASEGAAGASGGQPLFPPTPGAGPGTSVTPAAPVAPPQPAPQAVPSVPAAPPAPVARPAVPAPVAPPAAPANATPARPSAAAPTPPVAATPAAPALAAVSVPPPAPKLVIDFDGRSWVEVKDATQRVVFTGEYGAGTHQVVNGKPPFSLWIGKASAVRVNYKEQKVNLQPHTRDEVARLNLE